MATLWISEFYGYAANNPGVPALPAKASQLATIAGSSAASTGAVGATTNVLGLSADAGCVLLFGSSSSTGVVSSTFGGGSIRVAANQPPIYVGVSPYSRFTLCST